jgi:predicted metal-dependent phosphoesterase TrpH
MSICHDLHTHSTESDGTLTPTQLVERAAGAGIDVLALTDHDTLSGCAEAAAAAEAAGIGFWPGVEVSVSWSSVTIHVVGLRVDPGHGELAQGLAKLRDYRQWRAEEMGRRLAKRGIEGAYEGARALSNGRLVARTHFARFLVQSGIVEEERKVYKKYLTPGKPGFVSGRWASLSDAVGWIRDAGGRAVIAHPARYKLSNLKLGCLLKEFREAGGEGLEVISGSHNPGENNAMAKLAQQYQLLGSMGSDYHGPESSWLELGRLPTLPAEVQPIWTGWS